MKKMNVLVACEESQVVCKAFREKGHNAFSCDIQEPSGNHPEWHFLGDALPLLSGGKILTMDGTWQDIDKWDLLIAHPPCTFMCNASAMRMRVKGQIVPERYEKAMQARAFFMEFYNSDIPHIAIENPVPMKLIGLPPYTQIIQPYEYGHPYSKRTCLWLKSLPKLKPTKIIDKHEPYINGGYKDAQGKYKRFPGRHERDQTVRSRTFPGIAQAMADQWSDLDDSDE